MDEEPRGDVQKTGGFAQPSPEDTLDLTSEAPGPRTIQLQIAPYDPGRAREWVRGGLAIALMLALILLIGGAGWFFLWHADQIDLLEKFLGAVMTPLVGLVGAVTGFYFGEKASKP